MIQVTDSREIGDLFLSLFFCSIGRQTKSECSSDCSDRRGQSVFGKRILLDEMRLASQIDRVDDQRDEISTQ